ncbi:glycosyltransferase family 39 protein [bacterium]|nr:glycosyltransferase family 39 protein [bacterium]
MQYACENENLLSAFVPQKAILFDMHRPMQNITWWLLFHIFGFNPFPYQVFCTFLYGISFLLFFQFLKLVFNKRIALLSVILYLIIFYPLGYIIFWFSDLTYILEIFFINLALYLIIRAIQIDKQYIWGIISYVFGILSKEPVAFIVPLCTLSYLITDWKNLFGDKTKRLGITLFLWLTGIIYVLFKPYIHYRQGVNFFSDIFEGMAFIMDRWHIYSDFLISGPGILILITTIFLTTKCLLNTKASIERKKFLLILVISTVISILLSFYTEWASVVLFLCLFILAMKRHRTLVGTMWFAFSFLGILTITFIIRTMLIEASFGIVIVAAAAMNDIIDYFGAEWKQFSEKIKIICYVCISLILISSTYLFGIGFFNRYVKILRIVSASRQNLGNAIDYMIENIHEEPSFLFIINYEMMDMKREDVYFLPDYLKAQRMKTMNKDDLRRMFYLLKNEHIRVIGLGEFLGNVENELPENSYLLTMNNYENDFIQNLPIRKEMIFRTDINGESAFIYRFLSYGSG